MSRLMNSLFPMHAAVAMAAAATAKEENAQRPTLNVQRPTWNAGLPDSDVLVMIRLESAEYPVEIGFHDGIGWRTEANKKITTPCVGWMHLDEAIKLLDGASRTGKEGAL